MGLSSALMFGFCLFSSMVWGRDTSNWAVPCNWTYTTPELTLLCSRSFISCKSQRAKSTGIVLALPSWRLWLWTPGLLGVSSALKTHTPALVFPQAGQRRLPLSLLLLCSWISFPVLAVITHDISYLFTPLCHLIWKHTWIKVKDLRLTSTALLPGNRSSANLQCPAVLEPVYRDLCVLADMLLAVLSTPQIHLNTLLQTQWPSGPISPKIKHEVMGPVLASSLTQSKSSTRES